MPGTGPGIGSHGWTLRSAADRHADAADAQAPGQQPRMKGHATIYSAAIGRGWAGAGDGRAAGDGSAAAASASFGRRTRNQTA